MTFSSDQTKKALLRKGFVKDKTHHQYFTYSYQGKMVARTRVSHNDQEINDYLISKMKSQCQLNKNQFIDLINCPLDENGYVEILKASGIIKTQSNEEEPKGKKKSNGKSNK